MKYRTPPAFERDYRRRSPAHRRAFREAALAFNACAERAAKGEDRPWANGLRVKPVRGTERVWEMTWSMRDPDGRATWQWDEVDGEPAILWRRIGGHGILDRA